jgi:hypothetical protein
LGATLFPQPIRSRLDEQLDNLIVIDRFKEPKEPNLVVVMFVVQVILDRHDPAHGNALLVTDKRLSIGMLIKWVVVRVELLTFHFFQWKDRRRIILVDSTSHRKKIAPPWGCVRDFNGKIRHRSMIHDRLATSDRLPSARNCHHRDFNGPASIMQPLWTQCGSQLDQPNQIEGASGGVDSHFYDFVTALRDRRPAGSYWGVTLALPLVAAAPLVALATAL